MNISYHFWSLCEKKVAARCLGSSTCPKQTDVCTHVFRFAHPPAHYLHRYDKPRTKIKRRNILMWYKKEEKKQMILGSFFKAKKIDYLWSNQQQIVHFPRKQRQNKICVMLTRTIIFTLQHGGNSLMQPHHVCPGRTLSQIQNKKPQTKK